jgi:hypothetical protein
MGGKRFLFLKKDGHRAQGICLFLKQDGHSASVGAVYQRSDVKMKWGDSLKRLNSKADAGIYYWIFACLI